MGSQSGSTRWNIPFLRRLPDRPAAVALIAAVVLAAVGIGSPATSSPPIPDPRPAVAFPSAARAAVYGPAVSAMSFNACGAVCRKGEVKRTAAYIARRALSRKVDVAFLQELCFSQYQQLRTLMTKKGYSTFFVSTTTSRTCDNDDRRHGTGFGMALLVRVKVWGRTVKQLPVKGGRESRAMLGVTTRIGGRSTFVAVVHLSPTAKAGLTGQLRVLSADLNARALRPVIVGGDFNARPTDAGMARFYSHRAGGLGRFVELDETHHGLSSRSGEATFDAANRKIDYIFASTSHFGAPQANSYATGMSDHHLYTGTLRVVRR